MANKPKIRFNNYSDEWKERQLGDYAEKITDKNFETIYKEVFTNSAEYGIISQQEYFEHDIANKNNISGYYIVKPNDFVYNPRISKTAPVGPIKRNKIGRTGIVSPLYFVFKLNNIDLFFFDYFFDGTGWHQFMRDNGNTGARFDRFSISEENFWKMKIKSPNANEQKDIGTFFTHITSLIASTQEKLDKAIILKKSMLEKMFPQNDAKIPELRFKGFSGEWNKKKLSDYLEVVTEKNIYEQYGKEDVLSVSGDFGVVNQIEFQGKSLAGASLINYGVVHTGDVVYTKSPLKEQPYGIIKTNKGKTGIVSALYGVFRKNSEINTDFIQYYFESDRRLNEYLRPIVNKGAKNTLLVSDEDSLKGIVYIPSIKEQEIIIQYFDESSKLITNYRNELEKLKTIKKSLLDKMFV